ncbi:shikimate dehydrogenase [Streptomyces sp. NPDC059373]
MSHLIGLIGSGVSASLSPALHEREGRLAGLNLVYRAIDLDELGIDPAATPELLHWARTLGYTGLNITHPCKQIVLRHLDQLSPDAEAIGAVNTVVFDGTTAIGHNTDWSGFARGFARTLPGAAADRVVLLGAGGAGAAVAHAALTTGAGLLTVIDADLDRAAALTTRLGARFGADRAEAAGPEQLPARLAAADGLIHATPTGMAAHPGSAVDPDLLRPDLWIAEVVYRPLETELVRQARAAGCQVVDGGGMAVYQAADAFRLFTGLEPDADRMLEHLSGLVSAQVA